MFSNSIPRNRLWNPVVLDGPRVGLCMHPGLNEGPEVWKLVGFDAQEDVKLQACRATSLRPKLSKQNMGHTGHTVDGRNSVQHLRFEPMLLGMSKWTTAGSYSN